MRLPTRKLRHWKQRFNKDAKFIWARQVTWKGEQTVPGEQIPADLAAMTTKLRRFWEAKLIHLAEFEAPNIATGQVEVKEHEPEPEPKVKNPKNIWDRLSGSLSGDKDRETQTIGADDVGEMDDSWLDGEDEA